MFTLTTINMSISKIKDFIFMILNLKLPTEKSDEFSNNFITSELRQKTGITISSKNIIYNEDNL